MYADHVNVNCQMNILVVLQNVIDFPISTDEVKLLRDENSTLNAEYQELKQCGTPRPHWAKYIDATLIVATFKDYRWEDRKTGRVKRRDRCH
jgi:hypothetical protein